MKRYPCEEHPLYSRWLSMTQRCNNPNHRGYKNYGGRGISIAKDLQEFSDYSEYVQNLPGYDESKLPKMTLDRRKNNGDYARGNLRWVDHSVQIANQRPNSKGFNDYTGVNWSNSHNRWVARISLKGKNLLSSTHLTEELALQARNQCIKENNLPHPIQIYHS